MNDSDRFLSQLRARHQLADNNANANRNAAIVCLLTRLVLPLFILWCFAPQLPAWSIIAVLILNVVVGAALVLFALFCALRDLLRWITGLQ